MKKLFYPLFALAAMAMTNTSCQDELENGAANNGNEATVSFKVQLENAVGSRLAGDGKTAKELHYAVYKVTDAANMPAIGNEIEALRGAFITDAEGNVADKTVKIGDDLTAEIKLTLVKGQTYNFLFWAQCEGGSKYYTVNYEAGTIDLIYDVKDDVNTTDILEVETAANDENRDAFFKVRKGLKVNGPIEETIILKRPFAQVNVGTEIGSLKDAQTAEVTIETSEFVVDNVATHLDAYSGAVSTPKADGSGNWSQVKLTFTKSAITESNHTDKEGDLKDVKQKNYEHLAMNYILVDDQNGQVPDGSQQAIINATFSIYGTGGNEAGKPINTFTIPNIPVQRNWRTNIIGDIMNETVTFNIVIDPKFDDDHNVDTAKDLAYAFANGGEVTLEDKTYTLEEAMTLTGGKNVVLNLNGANIVTTKGTDAFVVNDGTLTIKGEGTITTEDKTAGYAIIANGANAVVNIYGGTYTIGLDDVAVHGDNACNSAVYTKNGGVANIYGGTYKVSTTQDIQALQAESKTRFLLNRNGTQATAGGPITVYGGTFHEFNPADNVAEGAGTNFVAEGYKAVLITNENTYCVIEKGAQPAMVAAELKTYLEMSDKDVAMVTNMDAEAILSMTAGNTLNGLGNKLTLKSDDNGTYAIGINVAGGEIKNLVIDGENKKSTTNQKGYRAIFLNNVTKDVVIDNVHISGVAYTMNTGGTIAANLKLDVLNSTLIGWTSYDKFASALFENCHFGVGSYYDAATIATNPGWNGCIRPYVTTVLNNCTFDEGFCLMLDKLATDATITLKNCMVGNQVVNKDNIQTLLGVAYDAQIIKF